MEKRRNKRFPFEVSLRISELYKQDRDVISDIEEEFEVIDISRSGLGFLCKNKLPLDYYFNAKITINEEKFFYGVLKIIRIEERDNIFNYGCEFVGLADILSKNVDELE